MLELTKFGDIASEKEEPECTGKKVGGLGGCSDLGPFQPAVEGAGK